jgi:uncharacterized LabA/DUF88 family protein
MSHPEKEILKRLGSEGLTRVLGDLLDRAKLVRLANSCGLKYPGMRTQTQRPERILADLVKRAGHEDATRKAIFRVLQKETRAPKRQWAVLSDEEKLKRLEDDGFLFSNGRMGTYLFITASSESEEDRDQLDKLMARAKKLGADGNRKGTSAKATKPSREQARLNKRISELQKKVQHLEGQVAKSRESEKVVKKDLIKRKGELAESRTLIERLQRDLTAAVEEARKASVKKKPQDTLRENMEQIGKTVRRLASQQRKLIHQIEKIPDNGATASPVDPEALAAVAASLQETRKELAALRRESKKELQQQGKRLETLLTHFAARNTTATESDRKSTRSSRLRPGAERVGVFIDVQNMYYGARQLKGKLDFDALLEGAVRDRRLIQATAYVVESKEIDQSGFIAILQQRAIEVRRKTLQVRADGSMKGDWDMELALDILDAAPGLDVVVLVSGDGDFTSLAKRVKRMGPRVEVLGFPRNTAKSLLEAADHFQPLNRKFMIYADGGTPTPRPAKAGSRKKGSRQAKKAAD